MTSSGGRFHVIDYVVFAVTIVLSITVGLIFAFKGGQKTNQEYLVGNRKMKVIPIAASILVSYLSTLDILGNPAEVYAYGAQYMLYPIALMIGMVVGTFVFVPLYYPLGITSVFEYHRMRFHAFYVEYLLIFLSLLTMTLFNAVLIYSPCMAFESVSGFPAWASMLISGFATIIYTVLGGMQAVVWTDCFQAVVILGALFTVIIKGTLEVGGVAEVWRINGEWGRLEFFNFSFDPTERLTFWSVIVMNSMMWMSLATAQPSVQRFVALPSLKKATISSLCAMPGFVMAGLLTCSCGVTAFAYYAKKGCDPMSSGQMMDPNQIMPHFVMDVLDIPALPGLFVACLFSASLSSVSSCYNAFAAIIWESFLKKRFKHLPPNKQTNIIKIATLLFGVVSIALSFLIMNMGGTLIQIAFTIIGTLGGPVIGAFFTAGLLPRAGPRGVFVGMIVGLVICVWMGAGATFSGHYFLPLPGPTDNCSVIDLSPDNTSTSVLTGALANVTDWPISVDNGSNVATEPTNHDRTWLEWMYSVSYFYYPFIGLSIVVVISLIFSIMPCVERIERVHKKLLVPCVRPCCGVEEDALTIDDKSEVVAKELECLTKPEVNDNEDVWVLREDFKQPIKS